MSSRSLDFLAGELRPGGCLVVEGSCFQAAVQDADQPAGELAQRGAVADPAGALVIGLPRVFRTAELELYHAASCRLRYSSWASCGVRYPSAEWRRVRLYRSSMYRAISSLAFFLVG